MTSDEQKAQGKMREQANARSRTVGLMLALLALALAASAKGLAAEGPPFLEGKLVSVPGGCPILQINKKTYALTTRTPFLLHTLQDQRLAHREIRVIGTAKPDGTFEVLKFYTIRDGKLFRVRYYCEICNIEALEPGNCVCCQQPTELQEIPLSPSP